VQPEGFDKLMRIIHLTGLRTRNLPACSTTASAGPLSRVPIGRGKRKTNGGILLQFYLLHHNKHERAGINVFVTSITKYSVRQLGRVMSVVEVSNLPIVSDRERDSRSGQALLNVSPSSMPDSPPSPNPYALVGVNSVRHPPIKSQVV
jgi:hypothetical protein